MHSDSTWTASRGSPRRATCRPLSAIRSVHVSRRRNWAGTHLGPGRPEMESWDERDPADSSAGDAWTHDTARGAVVGLTGARPRSRHDGWAPRMARSTPSVGASAPSARPGAERWKPEGPPIVSAPSSGDRRPGSDRTGGRERRRQSTRSCRISASKSGPIGRVTDALLLPIPAGWHAHIADRAPSCMRVTQERLPRPLTDLDL